MWETGETQHGIGQERRGQLGRWLVVSEDRETRRVDGRSA